MTYAQTLDQLFKASPSLSAKLNLDNPQAFDRALSAPASSYPTVHIAGSNGKGSVTLKIAKTLELSGYRVGIYTSPHLFCFRERIMINQERISEEEVTLRMQQIFSINEQLGLNATFFELTTFLAFDYFRKEKVDVAIIETGLGGKLDATNVIHPLLSVITSISREHTQILGDNIEQIAAEKAGILKKHVPVILGPKARVQSIYNRAKELNCPIFTAKKVGFFDEENSQTARLALDQLSTHFKIQPAALEQGLEVRPQCRLERVGDVIFDVAHNPDAIFHLLQALHNFFPKKPLRFVVGFSKDKEYNLCLDLIADVATHIHLVQTDSSRAAKVKELEAVLKDEDPSLFTPHASIGEGVKAAHFEATAKNEILVICGSFYIMAEAKQALSFQKIP